MAATNNATANGLSPQLLRQLQERIGRIEQELAQLKAVLAEQQGPQKPWWEKTAGMFAADEQFHQVTEWMRKEREKDKARVGARMDRQEQRERERELKRKKAKK